MKFENYTLHLDCFVYNLWPSKNYRFNGPKNLDRESELEKTVLIKQFSCNNLKNNIILVSATILVDLKHLKFGLMF